MIYQCYVRGHGGQEDHVLPPPEHLSIDLITVGEMGCTMSDEVADNFIFRHYSVAEIQQAIDNNVIIYWTHEQRDLYYDTGELNYTSPKLTISPYDTINVSLALDGDDEIGKCGVCYWSAEQGELVWILELADGETILLSEILARLKKMITEGDIIQLYWTACLSGRYWKGSRKKVSRNPEMLMPRIKKSK